MSDTTLRECIKCGEETDCIEGICQECALKQQPKATSIGNKIREIASKDILGQTKLVRDKDILNQAADRLDAWWKYINELKEEVDLLKQPKCKTCGDTKQKYVPPSLGEEGFYIPCPDWQQPKAGDFRQKVTCALLDSRSTEEQRIVALNLLHEAENIIDQLQTEQPTATSELTRWLREIFGDYDQVKGHTKVLEACDRLDRAEAINKDLLDACEYSHTLILRNIGQSTHAVALLEAAIAKAK